MFSKLLLTRGLPNFAVLCLHPPDYWPQGSSLLHSLPFLSAPSWLCAQLAATGGMCPQLARLTPCGLGQAPSMTQPASSSGEVLRQEATPRDLSSLTSVGDELSAGRPQALSENLLWMEMPNIPSTKLDSGDSRSNESQDSHLPSGCHLNF